MRFLKPAALTALILAYAAAHATHCTNGATNWPTCTPASPAPSTSTSSTASATAAADASAAQHQGQHQGQQQNAVGIGQGGNVSDASSFSSHMYVLPAPVFTPPMAAVDCPAGVSITNDAASIGWNFASVAHGRTDNSDCVLIALRNAYVEQCQYASAKQVQDLLTAKLLPGFKSSGTAYLDLTRAECDALKLPPLPTQPTLIYVPTVELPVVKPRKRVKTVLPCERVLAPGQTWQCKAKK
jgi:hypothetical protein